MYVRTIVADVVPGRAEEAVRIFREEIVPVIREQPGYVRTAIYVDREAHKAQTVSFWETKEAMESTSQGSAYLAKVIGLLRSCLVNRDYGQWEVGFEDVRK
ncbi:MAG TPA: antibiotic biosynthesis monooxygenase [Actinomycetota bacterium]|nr:antibiotic biosynthesis monooxygenase [Actinomycetota bacterium]